MVATIAENLRLIKCSVGQDTYGLEMEYVRSIAHADSVNWSDDRCDGAIGEIEDAEETIPVFSLAALLGRPPTGDSRQQVVVVLRTDPSRALLVERVSQVTRVLSHHQGALPSSLIGRRASLFRGIVNHEGELLLILSPDRLFDARLTEGLLGTSQAKVEPAPTSLASNQSPPVHLGHGQLLLFKALTPISSGRAITCGLSMAQVLEILEPPTLVPVPAAPPLVEGLVSWGDHSIPVLDLTACLGFPSAATKRTRLLVACVPGSNELLAFRVQSAIRMLRLPVPHQLSTRSLTLNEKAILGAFELKNETMILLDLAGILDFAKHESDAVSV